MNCEIFTMLYKSDKPWFNKSCLEKRNKFHTAKNRYGFVLKK